jgi:hypothetical protein
MAAKLDGRKHILAYKFYKVNVEVDRLCGLVIRVLGYLTEMYCDSCEVRTEFISVMYKKEDRLCGLVVRVSGYRSRGLGFDSRSYKTF